MLQLDRQQAPVGEVEARIILLVRHADQPAVGGIGPAVIGAGQPPRAAAVAVDQPRAAVAADIGEGADPVVGAAHDDDAFAEKLERPPVAGRRNVAGVADDLPGGPDQPLHLDGEIFGIVIDPAGQAQILLRVAASATRRAGDFGHGGALACSDREMSRQTSGLIGRPGPHSGMDKWTFPKEWRSAFRPSNSCAARGRHRARLHRLSGTITTRAAIAAPAAAPAVRQRHQVRQRQRLAELHQPGGEEQ